MRRRKPAHSLDRALAKSLLHASVDMSAAPLLALPSLLQDFGVDVSGIFRRVGIDRHALGHAANRLPVETVGRLLDECARTTDCSHFGLLLGIRSGAASAGIASELMRHAETVGDGLRLLIAHLHLHDRGGVVALTARTAGAVEMSYVVHHPHTPGASQITDASIAIACSILRVVCGRRWAASEVMLARTPPPLTRPYRAFFRAPVRFDSPRSVLVFPASVLDRPVMGADPKAKAHLLALAAELEAVRPATVSELTVRALSRMVIAMPPSGDKVAELLGIKRRRLREQLEAEGTSVKELLEDVRSELARQLLEQTRMPIGEISVTLHYSKPGAFSRAFKFWTGKTPRQWRTIAWRSAQVPTATKVR